MTAHEQRFLLVGNRAFVYDEMVRLGLDVARVVAIENSYLARTLEARGTAHEVAASKSDVVDALLAADVEVVVVNGCPYILPMAKLDDGRTRIVNIHPSPLPDLRGADPVPGALLYRRDSGATAHLMDAGIDSGPIISRVVIPFSDDLDAGLLYQMSFDAEVEVFRLALERNFEPSMPNKADDDCVYYTRKDTDLFIDLAETTSRVLARIRAFSNRSQGARLEHADTELKVYDAQDVSNPWLLDRIDRYQHGEVVYRYESTLVLRHHDSFLKLKSVEGDLSKVAVGVILGSTGASA
jgi:methionyl-tRNA formyltransferase